MPCHIGIATQPETCKAHWMETEDARIHRDHHATKGGCEVIEEQSELRAGAWHVYRVDCRQDYR